MINMRNYLMQNYLLYKADCSTMINFVQRRAILAYRFMTLKNINANNIQSLKAAFQQKPSPSVFKQYFNRQNFIQIYKIVKESRINAFEKVKNLTALQDLCKGSDQADLGILTTLKTDKAQMLMGTRKYIQALNQIQQAVSLVGIRENINPIEAAHIYRVAADVYIQLKQFPKASRSLQQAQSILISFEDPTVKDRLFSLSQIKTAMAMIAMNDKNYIQAKKCIDQAFTYWNELSSFTEYPTYGNSLLLKCSIYRIFKLTNQVQAEAKQYLPLAKGHIRMWLANFLLNQGNIQYQKECEQIVMQEMMKLQPQKRQEILKKLQKIKISK